MSKGKLHDFITGGEQLETPRKSKLADFVTGDNCARGKGQRKAFNAVGGFFTGIAGFAIVGGMVVAFGFWAIAVIVIILGINMMTPKKD